MIVKKRGRPSNAELAARKALAAETAKRNVPKSDEAVLKDLRYRFDMLAKLTRGCMDRNVRAMVVTGAPGIGKTHTVDEVLNSREGAKFEIVKGALSAVNLYKLGYAYRNPGDVIVLDDADSIFADLDAVNVLKGLCDSSLHRNVHWMKESSALAQEDVPRTYEFGGSFIFISNIDFQGIVDDGKSKFAPHLDALMSRSLYVTLNLHNRQSISLWVEEVATNGMLFRREGVDAATGKRIVSFIKTHRDELRELSLRTVIKLCSLAKSEPREWENMARCLMLRSS